MRLKSVYTSQYKNLRNFTLNFDIEDQDADRYWKPEGITKDFLDRLAKCISPAAGNIVRDEGYFAAADHYKLRNGG